MRTKSVFRKIGEIESPFVLFLVNMKRKNWNLNIYHFFSVDFFFIIPLFRISFCTNDIAFVMRIDESKKKNQQQRMKSLTKSIKVTK